MCGGGLKVVASLSGGRLQAPEDGLQGRLVAPADALPEEFMDLTAPLDLIPKKFAHYLTSVEAERRRTSVMGLTARFYSAPPCNCCNGPSPKASSIDRALDYRMGGSFQRLQEHVKHADSKGFFYGQWTGTLQILQKGAYVFDLDLGFDSMSSMKINGQELLTYGQCRMSKARVLRR